MSIVIMTPLFEGWHERARSKKNGKRPDRAQTARRKKARLLRKKHRPLLGDSRVVRMVCMYECTIDCTQYSSTVYGKTQMQLKLHSHYWCAGYAQMYYIGPNPPIDQYHT